MRLINAKIGDSLNKSTIVIESPEDIIEGCELTNVDFNIRAQTLFKDCHIKNKDDEKVTAVAWDDSKPFAKIEGSILNICRGIQGGFLYCKVE